MFASVNFNDLFSVLNSISCFFISSIFLMHLIPIMVSSVLQHWSQSKCCTRAGPPSLSLADQSATSSLHFLGDFLLTGMVIDVGSMGRLRKGNSSFHNHLPVEFTKCSLHTWVLSFTGKFFQPIIFMYPHFQQLFILQQKSLKCQTRLLNGIVTAPWNATKTNHYQ